MKILCVSDFVDPLIYNQQAKETFSDIDLVLCAGDLPLEYIDFIVSILNKPTYFIFGNHNLKDYKFYHKSAQDIPGNMPSQKENSLFGHGAEYLGFKVIRERSLTVTDSKTGKKRPLLLAGVSGSLKYNNGLSQYTEFEMKMKLIGMIPKLIKNKIRYGTYLDIFMTHASPRHIHDKEDICHRGFKCYNWFIKKFKPRYLVHGHIHLYDMRETRITQVQETTVINAYAHYIIQTEGNNEF
ncbi:MAG: metallophosphoesterase [Treponema sp.]|nr:metallophosphoesterase [Treponema sp.]